MKRKRHRPQHVVRKLQEAEAALAAGRELSAVCQMLGISEETYYRWKSEYGGIGRRRTGPLIAAGVVLAVVLLGAVLLWPAIRTGPPDAEVTGPARAEQVAPSVAEAPAPPVTLADVVRVRTAAHAAWDKVKDLAPSEGLDALLATAQETLANADEFYRRGAFAEAKDAYTSLQRHCDELLQRDAARRAAAIVPTSRPSAVRTPPARPVQGAPPAQRKSGARTSSPPIPQDPPRSPTPSQAPTDVRSREPEIYAAWPFTAAEAKRRQAATAAAMGIPETVTLELGDGVTMDFVLIPAGEFMMGSPSGEAERLHRVTLTRPYYLAATEVTQAQWRAVMGSNPSSFKGSDRLPVECVSWEDATAFCRKVGHGLRLPTEAEWEYACRAGTDSRYCFGDSHSGLGAYAWYGSNSDSQTHPVERKRPNAFGLYDMHGNVWEWCSDWFASGYSADGSRDPQGPGTGYGRVYRGGGWFYPSGGCRSADRSGSAPGIGGSYLGFRPALPSSWR